MIYVVDAIMGSGKTEAAIRFIKLNPDRKYLYVTPYNSETTRMAEACAELGFCIPLRLNEFGGKKGAMLIDLVASGRNIACTHELYKRGSPELSRLLREAGYTVIIDEVMDVFEPMDEKPDDFNLLVDAGVLRVTESDNKLYAYYERNKDYPYEDGRFVNLVRLAETRRLLRLQNGEFEQLAFWVLPHELFDAARDVFVLCYMFDGAIMKAYLDLMNLPYTKIGVNKIGNRWNGMGVYEFSDMSSTPEYAGHLSKMIHICENDKMNAIGRSRNALSASWFKRLDDNDPKYKILKNNTENFFRHFENISGRKTDLDERLWTVFNDAHIFIKGKGYASRFIGCTARATNEYSKSISLAYLVNMFLQPPVQLFFQSCGCPIDQKQWATGTMVQWIWRSAIRNGEEIWIYVPSSRMRGLLKDWIADVERQYAEGCREKALSFLAV